MSADYVLMGVGWVLYGSLGNLPETTCPKVKKLSLLLQSSIAQRLSARWSLMSSSCISVECCLALSPADNHSHSEFRSAEPCHVQKTALHSIFAQHLWLPSCPCSLHPLPLCSRSLVEERGKVVIWCKCPLWGGAPENLLLSALSLVMSVLPPGKWCIWARLREALEYSRECIWKEVWHVSLAEKHSCSPLPPPQGL